MSNNNRLGVGIKSSVVVALTPGTTLNTNCVLGSTFTCTPNVATTIANPINPANGQEITYIITQGSTVGDISFGNKFKCPLPIDLGTMLPDGYVTGQVTIIKATYIQSIDTWLITQYVTGENVNTLTLVPPGGGF